MQLPLCKHSNPDHVWGIGQFKKLLQFDTVLLYYGRCFFHIWSCEWILKLKLLSSTFLWCCLLCYAKWFLPLSLSKFLSVTIKIKATEQYSPVVLFIMMYKVVLTFKSVDEILKCGHPDESYWAVFSCGTVYYTAHGSSSILETVDAS